MVESRGRWVSPLLVVAAVGFGVGVLTVLGQGEVIDRLFLAG